MAGVLNAAEYAEVLAAARNHATVLSEIVDAVVAEQVARESGDLAGINHTNSAVATINAELASLQGSLDALDTVVTSAIDSQNGSLDQLSEIAAAIQGLRADVDQNTAIINAAIDSTDVDLDQLSEVAAGILQLMASIDGLTIASVSGLQAALDSKAPLSGLEAEAATRSAADAQLAAGTDQLADALESEANRTDGLVAGLADEVAARSAADATEATAREQGDAAQGARSDQLESAINAEAAARAAADGAEAQARIAGDAAAGKAVHDYVATGELDVWPNPTAEGRSSTEPFASNVELLADGAMRVTAHAASSGPVQLLPHVGYRFEAKVRVPSDQGTLPRVGLLLMDHDGLEVTHESLHYQPGTLTTLAAPLQVGDVQMQLTDAADWDVHSAAHKNRVCIAQYVDGRGVQFPADGYSRHYTAGEFVSGVSGNTVAFSQSWSIRNPATDDGHWPAGTAVRQALSGESYHYLAPISALANQGEHTISFVYDGDDHDGAAPRQSGRQGLLHDFDAVRVHLIAYQSNVDAGVAIELLDFHCFPISESAQEADSRHAAALMASHLASVGRLNVWPNGFASERLEAPVEASTLAQQADGALLTAARSGRELPLQLLPNQAYRIQARIRLAAPATATIYLGWDLRDYDGLVAEHRHLYFQSGTLTTLAAPLRPGDTIVQLSDGSAWEASSAAHRNQIAVGGYVDGRGHQYSPGGYTRHVSDRGMVAGVDGDNVSLASPWSIANPDDDNGEWPIGTPVRQAHDGGSAMWFAHPETATWWETAGDHVLEYRYGPQLHNPELARTPGSQGIVEDFIDGHLIWSIASAQWDAGVRIEIVDVIATPLSNAEAVHEELRGRAEVSDVLDAYGSAELSGLVKSLLPSGLLGVRAYDTNVTFTNRRRTHATFAAANFHTHADHRHTVGMAEWESIANGTWSRQRHTDFTTQAPEQGEYLQRRETPPPPVPDFVLAKPTGLNADGTLDLESDTQARWMRELIEGQHQEYVEAQVAWGEMWWEDVSTDSRSDAADSSRHQDAASGLLDELEYNQQYEAGGAKVRTEDLRTAPVVSVPVLNDDGSITPVRAQLNYRVNTRTVGHMGSVPDDPPVPTILVGVGANHVHTLDRQLTQAEWDDLRSGTVAEVLLTSSDVNHAHTYRVTWNATRRAADAVDTHPDHQHSVHVIQGFSGALPFDRDKARDGVIDATNRFRLRLDPVSFEAAGGTRESLARSMLARYECVDLEAAMNTCWGMEGEGAVLAESYLQPDGQTQYFYDIADPSPELGEPSLNAAMINRRAQARTSDAAGRSSMSRFFNDPNLMVAKTTHPRVVGGFTYALPLAVIMRSPIESWNPAGVTIDPADYSAGSAPGAGTQADPFTRAFGRGGWNFTPLAIWPDASTAPDPADTPRTLWMQGADGVAYAMSASGVWWRTPGGRRGALPCYLVPTDGTAMATEMRVALSSVKDVLGQMGATQAQLDSIPIDDAT